VSDTLAPTPALGVNGNGVKTYSLLVTIIAVILMCSV